ncbi:hypothetical protein FRX31_033228, partial [Thalictrum thalictroides]
NKKFKNIALSFSLTVTNKVFWIVISSDRVVVEEEEVQETLERRIIAYIDSDELHLLVLNISFTVPTNIIIC